MLKIEQEGNRLKVSVSEPGTGMRGYHVMARDMAEVHQAIDHYYRPNSCDKRHATNAVENCPFCFVASRSKT